MYKLLEFLCENNFQNQKYLFKYILVFKNHLGYGSFVAEFIQKCLFNIDDSEKTEIV